MSGRARDTLGVVAVAVALMLVSGAGASGATGGLDLSSDEAITAYLASIGVDPAAVVWQRGPLNYAGPSCPGAEWNCTTSTQVVQIAQAGGQNQFVCEPEGADSDPDTGVCVIVQSNGTNHARCTERTTDVPIAVQECTITQAGDRNFAHVDQTAVQTEGDTQRAEQEAEVVQDATEKNQVHVSQSVRQRTSTGTTQAQDAFQLAVVDQSVAGSDNYSHIHQTQDQRASGSAQTQLQNTEEAPQKYDCEPFQKPESPNQCAGVDQFSESGGKNLSQLHQAIGQRQTTDALFAEQQQGRLDGGQEGAVHQDNPPDAGNNHDVAHQDLSQRQSAPSGAFQEQFTDPGCCGIGTQLGGEINREDINQSVTQSASEGDDAFQLAELFGQVHQVGGGDGPAVTQLAEPNNRCDIDHHGRNNSGADHFSVSATGAACANLVLVTVCANSAAADEFGEEEGCAEPDFDVDSLGDAAVLRLATTPTFGLDIPMPDFGEPADFIEATVSG